MPPPLKSATLISYNRGIFRRWAFTYPCSGHFSSPFDIRARSRH